MSHSDTPNRAIMLVDCNSFFCSCERLFRPDLKNKPVVVLSNNDGCAISRTQEAKALGIGMAEPYFKFKHFCNTHGLVVFSANFALYSDISMRVMRLLHKKAPTIEVYSIDEAFLDVSGIEKLSSYGQDIKDKIALQVGIPVGVGVAPTKVLAKIANKLAKSSLKANGVVNLMDKKHQEIALSRTIIDDIWGIGRASTAKLHQLGLKTAKDLRDYPHRKRLQALLGINGIRIQEELQGKSHFCLSTYQPPKKEIMTSRSFGKPITQIDNLKEMIAYFVSDASEKMRSQHSLCQEISIFAYPSFFDERTIRGEIPCLYETVKLSMPTLDTCHLIDIALQTLEKSFQVGVNYKKAGVRLSSFYSSLEYQTDLFCEGDSPQKVSLMSIMDHINAKNGDLVLKSASCGILEKEARMNQQFKSPRYTTSWTELPVFC